MDIVAEWWHYDAEIATLYYEEANLPEPSLKKVQTSLYQTREIGDAWIGTSPLGEKIILWEDKELSPGKDLVAEVKSCELYATKGEEILKNFTYGIHCAVVEGKQPWIWEEGEELPQVKIRGHYRDGGRFEDSIRLIIPLMKGSYIAIGKSRGRKYFITSH